MGMNQFHFLYTVFKTVFSKINIRRQFVNQTELESLTITELHALAKQNGIPAYRKYKKAELIALLAAEDSAPKKRGRKPKADAPKSEPPAASAQADEAAPAPKKRGRPPKAKALEASEPTPAPVESPAPAEKPAEQQPEREEARGTNERFRQRNNRQQNNRQNHYHNRENNGSHAPNHAPAEQAKPSQVPELLQSPECRTSAGVLEIMDGYGFLRVENYDAGPKDVYISNAQIRRCNLKNGDYVEGRTRARREGDKYEAMLFVDRVNGKDPDENAQHRVNYEDLVPIFPNERYTLETPGRANNLAVRLIDLIAPIGKGQRAMIVSQPKAGKTTLLKQIANGITENYPDTHLIVLLIDERPEEVTDMRRSIRGEVVASTFDELPEHHTRIAEMVQERAMRLVEDGRDVVILLDSLTRLTRAYNLVIPPTGRTLSGGMDPGALHKPKRFFGAARNIENGGSLTVIATALVETGSRMDDIVYEEFKGTGNMEIHLDRKLSEKRIFPAIDVYKSGTRRDDLLLSQKELDGVRMLRRMLANGGTGDVTENLVSMMDKTNNNEDFLIRLKEWVRIFEKEGFTSPHQQNRYGQ